MLCLARNLRPSTPKSISIYGVPRQSPHRSYAVNQLPVLERANKFRANEQAANMAREMEKQNPRDWKVGDVYAPHDLSPAEARKWKKRVPPTVDAFDALSLNPLELYKNFSVMSEYMTEMGRIRGAKSTGLRAVNQRKIAKAIRRAVALGLMPSVHRHPEILKKNMLDYASQYGPIG